MARLIRGPGPTSPTCWDSCPRGAALEVPVEQVLRRVVGRCARPHGRNQAGLETPYLEVTHPSNFEDPSPLMLCIRSRRDCLNITHSSPILLQKRVESCRIGPTHRCPRACWNRPGTWTHLFGRQAMNSVTSPRVFGYSRVSTHEQTLSGLGLESQRAVIDAEASRHSWTVEHHADEGVSGSIRPEDRPQLGRILDEIRAGDVLVVAKLDRLGRSALDVLRLADDARAHGWRLVLLDLGLDTVTPIGAFTLTALAAVAQLERDLIAQRTRDALDAARRNGTRLGRPVEIDEDIRQRIKQEFHDGKSLSEIARTLTREGVPTARAGKKWYASTVQGVVRSLSLDREVESSLLKVSAI